MMLRFIQKTTAQKLIVVLITVITMVSLPVSCIKRDMLTQINHILKSDLILWMETQKTANTSSSAFIDSLENLAAWQRLGVLAINNLENLVYVPVNYNANKTGLVFIINNINHRVETGYLSEISATVVTRSGAQLKMQSQLTYPEVVMANFYRYRLNDFTGSILAYAITNKFLWEMGYSSGSYICQKKIVSFRSDYKPEVVIQNNKLKVSPFEGVTKINNHGGSEYLLVTYWEDTDASVSLAYLGEICDHHCGETRAITRDTGSHYITFCSAGGN